MTINDRVKLLRKSLNLTQIEFGKKIAVAQGYLTNIENGHREVTDKIIKLICLQFDINEDWLRTGAGDMREQKNNFSLDKYAKERGASDIDIEILKIYLNLDKNVRKKIVSDFKKIFIKDEISDIKKNLEEEKSNNQISNKKIENEITNYKPELSEKVNEKKITDTETKKYPIYRVPARGSKTGYFEFEMTDEMRKGFEEDLNYDDSQDEDLY